jgi:hypothetical protein
MRHTGSPCARSEGALREAITRTDGEHFSENDPRYARQRAAGRAFRRRAGAHRAGDADDNTHPRPPRRARAAGHHRQLARVPPRNAQRALRLRRRPQPPLSPASSSAATAAPLNDHSVAGEHTHPSPANHPETAPVSHRRFSRHHLEDPQKHSPSIRSTGSETRGPRNRSTPRPSTGARRGALSLPGHPRKKRALKPALSNRYLQLPQSALPLFSYVSLKPAVARVSVTALSGAR